MNDYLRKHMPETFEALAAGWAAVLEAAGEVSKAEAARARAEQAWTAAKAKANAEACEHFAANNRPSGEAVPADLLARVAAAVNTPALEWDSVARTFREKAAKGATGTVATTRRDGRVTLVVRLYLVEALPGQDPRWSRVASLEVWAHSGTVAGSGGRKRVVSEDDCAALLALAKGEVTT